MYIVAPYSRDMGWASSWTSPRPEPPVLGRLVALAKASAEILVGWLAGDGKIGKSPSGWKHAFRCGLFWCLSLRSIFVPFEWYLSSQHFCAARETSSPWSGASLQVSFASPVVDRMAIEEAQAFDVRLSLNAAVMSDTAPPSLSGSETFQRRRVKGCPALQTKAYKNLLGGGECENGCSCHLPSSA